MWERKEKEIKNQNWKQNWLGVSANLVMNWWVVSNWRCAVVLLHRWCTPHVVLHWWCAARVMLMMEQWGEKTMVWLDAQVRYVLVCGGWAWCCFWLQMVYWWCWWWAWWELLWKEFNMGLKNSRISRKRNTVLKNLYLIDYEQCWEEIAECEIIWHPSYQILEN